MITRNSSILSVPVAITIKGAASKHDILLFHKKGQQRQRQQFVQNISTKQTNT